MELITPGLGLLFWMTIAFGMVVLILKKYAWRPILDSLKKRDDSIAEALNAAHLARDEMAGLQAQNDELLRQARDERDALLLQARQTRDVMIRDAKETAQQEADRIIVASRDTIRLETEAAKNELKNQVAQLSLQIAEKLLKQELANDDKQKALMAKLLKEAELN